MKRIVFFSNTGESFTTYEAIYLRLLKKKKMGLSVNLFAFFFSATVSFTFNPIIFCSWAISTR